MIMQLIPVTSTDLVRLALDIRGATAVAVTGLFLAFDGLNPDWGDIPLTREELAIFENLRETRNPQLALKILDSVMLPVAGPLGLRRTDLDQAAREARMREDIFET